MDWNALALRLEHHADSIEGVNALDYVPDSLPNTGFYVGEMEIQPNQSFNKRRPDGTRIGTDQGTITCRFLVARTTDKYSVRKSRTFMAGSGVTSFCENVQQDQTLGGACSGNKIARISGNRMFVMGPDEKKYYGVEIDVFVIGAA